MAGRLLTLRLLRSALRPSPQALPSYSVDCPLSSAPSLSILNCLFASRFFSNRRAVSKEKSLIDDEAELSDWISDLKTDSVRFRLSSDSDDEFDRNNTRNPRGSTQKRRFYGDSDDVENNYRLASTRERGGRGGGRGRDRKESSFDLSNEEPRFRGQGRAPVSGPQRGGRDKKSFSGRTDKNGKESNFDFSEEERGFRGGGGSRMSESQRGGRRGRAEKELNFEFSNEERRGASMSVRQKGGTKTGWVGREMNSELSEEEDQSDNGFSDSEEEILREKNGESLELVKDEKVIKSSNDGDNNSYLSQKRFDECSLSQLTLKGVKSSGYERMTVVQEATLPVILQGKDVLAKARTGTGKTVAFLLPAIEMVAKLPPVDRDDRKPPFNVLIVCPTRELADQAAQEASKLLKHHASISVQLVIGGTRLCLEQKRMQTNPSQIVVGTPGRLKDHIENTPGFAARLKGVKALVLDEADRLLDMGFRPTIETIIGSIPKQRQTLLFSATVPDEVRQMCYIALKRDFEFINTVEEGSEETHSQVKQMHIVAPLENQFGILYGLLKDHISENVDYKVIVFCTTAMVTRLVSEYLDEMKLNVKEIHSRKPQSYRTRVSKEFRESKGLILVSSDVSARGVDYPNVTLVVQLGVPADREQYIHRLGRTGRKGKEGTGILILAPWENYFLRSIKDLPISEFPLPLIDPDTRKKVDRALAHVDEKNKEKAYQAWLGYYNSNKNVGRDKYQLVSLANEFSRSIGMDNPPALPKIVLRKMGLNNIPGLRSR